MANSKFTVKGNLMRRILAFNENASAASIRVASQASAIWDDPRASAFLSNYLMAAMSTRIDIQIFAILDDPRASIFLYNRKVTRYRR